MPIVRVSVCLLVVVIAAAEAKADPVTLRFSGIVFGVAAEYINAVPVPLENQQFAPLFVDGRTIEVTLEYDTNQPDTDPSANTGTYRIGRLSIAIPELGITASRAADSMQISAFNEAFPGFDQFFVYVDGVDTFDSAVGLPAPVAFSFDVAGGGTMLANDALPTAGLVWIFGSSSFNFLASDGTKRQILLNYLPVAQSRPPSITELRATPNVLWPPDRRMASVALEVAVNGDPVPSCHITAVVNNEGGAFPGEMESIVTGPLSVDLRAERSGADTGRLYTITVSCSNSAGSDSRDITVGVPHDQRR